MSASEAALRATVLALAVGPAVGVGIARFAYALLLPDMAADLHWSYAQGGLVNGCNAAGYMLGALVASPVMKRVGPARTLYGSTLVCILALFGSAFVRSFEPIVLARLVTGICGAFAFIAGAQLATEAAERSDRSPELLVGLFYIGPGLGILASALTVPLLQARMGAGSWQAGWAVLAVLSLALGAALLTIDNPRHLAPPRTGWVPLWPMAALLAGYLVFAAGSITYMTFMITWIGGQGFSWFGRAAFWAVLGLGAMAAPWLWAAAFRRLSGGAPLAMTVLVCMIGSTIPLLTHAWPALILSAATFGSAFFASVASTTLFVKRSFVPHDRAGAIAAATVAFGVGQAIGPVVTGAVADRLGSLGAGLGVGTLLMLVGAAIAFLQRDMPAPRSFAIQKK